MKQRLVGLLVLGSLALIFIPLLLDGEGVETPPLNLDFPPAPVVDQRALPEPRRPVILADQVEPSDQTEPLPLVQAPFTDSEEPFEVPDSDTSLASTGATGTTDTSPETTATVPAETAPPEAAPVPVLRSESEPALDAQGLPEAWTVRLGVFAERANAEALVARLLTAGHKAYLQPVRTAQGNTSGVFVGPVLTRQEAGTLQRELADDFGEGLVVRYAISP